MSERSPEQPWYEAIVIPALLRHARKAYGGAMRAALADINCDDIPKNGLYVIGRLAIEDAGALPLTYLREELGIPDDALQSSIDALVARGYLERATGKDWTGDGFALTARGRTAATAQAAGRERVDSELTARVGAECVSQMRKALGALCVMGQART